MPEGEWTVQVEDPEIIGQLRLLLNLEDAPNQVEDPNVATYLVDWFQNLRVEVFSNEHPPPHFRVLCAGETANYQIKNCTQLSGGLKRYHKVIRRWHSENKSKLIEAWNSRRPTDCTVGEYRDA